MDTPSGQAPDPFLTQAVSDSAESTSSAYSADRFYTSAQDKKGHSQIVRLPVPPTIHAAIGRIVASKDVPEYHTMGDFWRDAGVHRAQWLSENGALSMSRLAIIMRIASEAEEEKRARDFAQAAVRDHEEALQKASSRKDQLRILATIREHMSKYDDESFKQDCQRILDRYA